MNSRTTHVLLAIITIVPVAHFLHAVNLLPIAQAHSGAEISEVARTKLIEIVDGKGQVVAQLHSSEDGGGQLRLRSSSGAVRVKLGSTADGSGLILMDNDSEPAIVHSVGRSGTSLTLAQKGKNRRTLEP